MSSFKLLVIAPHPDDEILGCGGFIKKNKDLGGQVYVQYLTIGDTRDFSQKGNSTVSERKKEIEEVAKYLNFDDYHIGFIGNKHHLKLDLLGQKEVMQLIETDSPISIEKIKPTMILFPSLYSYNQDHQLASLSTHAALRPAEATKHFVELVATYEVPADNWSMFAHNVPNFFVPLKKEDLEAKITALKLYSSQLRPAPNPRSLEVILSLAKLRGSMCKEEYAEGFLSYRTIFT